MTAKINAENRVNFRLLEKKKQPLKRSVSDTMAGAINFNLEIVQFKAPMVRLSVLLTFMLTIMRFS